MDPSPVDRDTVVEHLDRVLRSPSFRRAERSSALLRFVVEQTLAGRGDALKEYTLGVEVLGRGAAFDQRTDPVVRAEASRLRDRLARYYATDDGTDAALVIELPKGSYVPRFVPRFVPRAAPPTVGAAVTEPAVAEPAVAEPAVAEPAVAADWRPTTAQSSRHVRIAVGAVIALAIAVAVATWTRSPGPPLANASLLRFDVELNSDGVLGSEVGPDVALSTDGTRLVFVARDTAGLAHLYTRRLDQPAAVRLPGTDGARVPFLSPDGRWVGFWAEGKVKRVPVDGGSPVVLCDATDMLGASWGEDGSIVAALSPTGRLWRIPETGGAPRAVLDLSAKRVAPVWPQILPGGEGVLYSTLSGAGADRGSVEVHSFRTGTRTTLVRGGTYGRYLPNGYLTYVNQGTLYAIPFDVARLAVRGTAAPVLEDVAYSRTFGYAQVDIASTGTLVYRRSAGSGQFTVASLDRAGRTAPLVPRPGRYAWARLSPDGRRLALTAVESGSAGIWIGGVDPAGGAALVRAAGPGADHAGVTWWPDGRHLIVGGQGGMGWIDAEHPAAPRALSRSPYVQVPWSVAPGGRLAYFEMNPATGFDLWTVPVTAAATGLIVGVPQPYLRTPAFEVYPAFSPDGRWVAYGSNASGTYEIYVRRYPDAGAAVRVSTGGGRIPSWSPNGRELLYQTDDHRIMVAAYQAEGGGFVATPPRAWTGQPLGDAGVFPSFAPAPDGDHVVALLPGAPPEERQTANHVTVVLNFLDEVRRRAGVVRSSPVGR